MFTLLATVLGLLPRALPAFGGEDPTKGSPWYHEKLTRLAATAAKWTNSGNLTDTPDAGAGAKTAASALAWVADYVDTYLYNPFWNTFGGVSRWKAAMFAHDDLIKVHFDDLTSVAQINLMWQRYMGGTVAAVLWAADRGDVAAARHAVGVGLHAMQDFYSHSNWVDDPARRMRRSTDGTGPQPVTWFDVPAGERNSLHLYTGTYELAEQHGFKHHGKIAFDCTLLQEFVGSTFMNLVCDGISPLSDSGLCRRWHECQAGAETGPDTVEGVPIPEGAIWLAPPGIALDSTWLAKVNARNRDLADLDGADPNTAQKLFRQALAAAQAHSTQWLTQLGQIMIAAGPDTGAFWTAKVMKELRPGDGGPSNIPVLGSILAGYEDDIKQFEQPNKLPATFLSAGSYPPAPNGSDEGWFVRLELHTADDEFGCGTQSDIDVEIGGKRFRLDHGNDQNLLMEFNDFEAGDHTWYVVGPLDQMPSDIVLFNDGTSFIEILEAAWHDFKEIVGSIVDAIGHFLISLVGGHPDYIGSDKATWSWAELEQVAESGGQDFSVRCNRGDDADEGDFRIHGRLTAEPTPLGLTATVELTQLDCIEEADVDAGSNSDEPFILMLVNSPATGELRRFRTSPFSDVDSDEEFPIGMEPISVHVPRHGGLLVPFQMWESDLEDDEYRDDLLNDFADAYGGETEPSRSQFLDALGEAILPDWKLAAVDAYAYRRGPVTVTSHLARDLRVDRWIEAGGSHKISLTEEGTRKTAIPALSPLTRLQPVTLPKAPRGQKGHVLGIGGDGAHIFASRFFQTIAGPPHPSPQFGTLEVIDRATLKVVKALPVGHRPGDLAVDPTLGRAYVVNRGEQSSSLSVVDTVTMTVIATLAMGSTPTHVAVNTGTHRVYVSTSMEQVIKVLDGATNTFLAPIPIGKGALGMVTDPATNRLYIALSHHSTQPHINAVGVVIDDPEVREILPPVVIGPSVTQPADVALDVDNDRLYTSNLGGGGVSPSVTVLEASTATVLTTIPIHRELRAISVHPPTRRITLGADDGVYIVDGETDTLITHLTLPPVFSIHTDPATGEVYAGDLDGGVTVVS